MGMPVIVKKGEKYGQRYADSGSGWSACTRRARHHYMASQASVDRLIRLTKQGRKKVLPVSAGSGNGEKMAGSNGNYSRYVYVYNKTRETFVATEAAVADNYFRRLIGLLGKTKRWAKLGRGLWIIPSRGVHSIGMLFPIDLVFLNKERKVVHVEEHFRPFRVSKVSLKAASVLELPPHTIYRTGTQVGDVLEITSIR
jgi:uncharacterized protein